MPHTIHIDKWVDRAQQDFYMLFVQTWIPFNAWYRKEIAPVAGSKKDRDCINYICHHSNTYKNKVVSLLSGTNKVSRMFRQEVADLHTSLMDHFIPDNSEPINFKTTSIHDLSTPLLEDDYYQYHYKVERISMGNGFQYDIRIEDKTTHVAKYTKHFNKWNLDDLQADANYNALSESVKKHTLELYRGVYPDSPTNVILEPVNRSGSLCAPPNSMCFDEENKVYFIRDIDKITQVLIQIIYSLRNQIFHGSLDPTDANQEVYRHLYVIQSMLIKELV